MKAKPREAGTCKDSSSAHARSPQRPEPAQGVGPTPSNMMPRGCPGAGPHVLSPRDSARETRGAPVILPLVTAGWGVPSGQPSSSSYGATPASPRPATGGAPSTSRATSGAGEDLGDELAFARGRSAVRFGFFGEAMRAMVHLGGELANVDTRLEAENRRLEDEWQRLKVAINLGKLQRDEAEARAAASLAASREACARAMEEAEAANRCRQAAEERERDLLSSNAALQREVEERRALLASSPGEVALAEAELLRRHEDLTLEAVEHSLALERLEVRERQAAVAEDAVAAREAQVQVEVEEKVAKARAELAEGHRLDLELLKAELEGRTSVLRTEM